MTRAYVEAPATHYRLSPETWAIIAEEYKNGATAKDIGAKWKVAPSSVYRYACRDGFTKKGSGDARARAHARLVEEEEAARGSLNPVGTRALKALFQPPPVEDPDAGDPAALARQATLASGRAMRGRLWAEAKALAGLAEAYSRLGEKRAAGAVGIDDLDLPTLVRIYRDEDGCTSARLAVGGDPDPDPVKRDFWRREGEEMAAARARWDAQLQATRTMQARVRRLEAQLRAGGIEPAAEEAAPFSVS